MVRFEFDQTPTTGRCRETASELVDFSCREFKDGAGTGHFLT